MHLFVVSLAWDRMRAIIKPYRPSASPKMRIKIMLTKSFGCCPVARTPASPTIPIAKPAASAERPQDRPAARWAKPLKLGYGGLTAIERKMENDPRHWREL